MKKLILSIIISLFTLVSYADDYKTCIVNGTTGSVVVQVYATDSSKGKATVSVSNDSEKPVNVSFTITFKNINSVTLKTMQRTKLVQPQSETTVDLDCGVEFSTVEVSSLSGRKCD